MRVPVKKGWLFDLDGTLLRLEVSEFIPRYVESLCHYAAPEQPELFRRTLLAATASMLQDQRSGLTNEEVFWEVFRASWGEQDLMPLLQRIEVYYREVYPQLGRAYPADPAARRVLELVAAGGGQLVLATNPVFPRVAVEERMRWAGIEGIDFTYITSYENMHSCKPGQEYYREILDRTGLMAQECIMVGNDVREDMLPAQALGMDTYLIQGMVIDPAGKAPGFPGGSLMQLVQQLERGEPG